jgi:hypothetical protein
MDELWNPSKRSQAKRDVAGTAHNIVRVTDIRADLVRPGPFWRDWGQTEDETGIERLRGGLYRRRYLISSTYEPAVRMDTDRIRCLKRWRQVYCRLVCWGRHGVSLGVRCEL